jgi:cytosine/adenosine deaminase-related metal-dependent hydrolase
MPLEPWLVWLYGVCGHYTARDHYLCAALSAIEMLLSGCTSTLDHLWHGGPWQREYLDAAMQANRDAGIRATVAPMYDDHDYVLDAGDALGYDMRGSTYGLAHGGYRPDRDDFRRGVLHDNLALFADWMRAWHRSADGRLQTFLGPGAGQLVSTECLQLSFELARKHGAGVHMHCVETRVQDFCIRTARGKTVTHWLYDEGLLCPEFTLPHSVWIRSAADLDRLAATGAIPVHNPAANLKLGSGLMALREMLQRNTTVALGVDGACSSDNQSMWDAIKLAALIHNLKDIDPHSWVTAREAFELGTLGGAAALLHKGELGRLEVGMLADIALLDQRNATLAPMNDAYGMLVHCETGSSVRHVIVNGALVVRDGKLLTLDVDALVAEFFERVDALPFRHTLDGQTQKDVDDCNAFWWDVMRRVGKGE